MTNPSPDRLHTAPIVLEEVRSSGSELRLKGYAAVFNSPSEDMGFREVLLPGAFTRALDEADVVLLWQHDTAQPLARQSAKNLRVWQDSRGLAFDATLPQTQLAKDAVTLTRDGVVNKMSFAFSMRDGKERTEVKGGELWRYVEQVGALHEISLVTEPAYASTSVEARSAALDAIRRHARPREEGPYGPEKPHSYFRDFAAVGAAKEAADAIKRVSPGFSARLRDVLPAHPVHGTVEDAEKRLLEVERRTVTPASIDIYAIAGPAFVGELFATAARTKAALAGALRHEPLPKNLNVRVPNLQSGASVGYQANAQPLSSTDPQTADFTGQVATIAGYVDAAQQDLDMTPGHLLDRAIATDLGAAFGAMLEQELFVGNGQADHLYGLLNIAGTVASSYTDATATPAEFLAAVGSAYAATSVSYGAPIDLIAIHSRRRAWLESKLGYPPKWPAPVLETEGIPTNLGAGSNEDVLLLLVRDQTVLMLGELQVGVSVEPNSGTLTIRYRSYGYAALLPLMPASVGKLNGSGLVTPVF